MSDQEENWSLRWDKAGCVVVTRDGVEVGECGTAGWVEIGRADRDPVPKEWVQAAYELWRQKIAGESAHMVNLSTEAQAREFWAELDERSRLLLKKTAPAETEPMRRYGYRAYKFKGDWYLQWLEVV